MNTSDQRTFYFTFSGHHVHELCPDWWRGSEGGTAGRPGDGDGFQWLRVHSLRRPAVRDALSGNDQQVLKEVLFHFLRSSKKKTESSKLFLFTTHTPPHCVYILTDDMFN